MYDEQGAEYIDCINNVAHGQYHTSGWRQESRRRLWTRPRVTEPQVAESAEDLGSA